MISSFHGGYVFVAVLPQVGFLQFFNLHRVDAQVQAVATSKRLASAAAQLLGAKHVRLYQV